VEEQEEEDTDEEMEDPSEEPFQGFPDQATPDEKRARITHENDERRGRKKSTSFDPITPNRYGIRAKLGLDFLLVFSPEQHIISSQGPMKMTNLDATIWAPLARVTTRTIRTTLSASSILNLWPRIQVSEWASQARTPRARTSSLDSSTSSCHSISATPTVMSDGKLKLSGKPSERSSQQCDT
jgi:hypothetical protein